MNALIGRLRSALRARGFDVVRYPPRLPSQIDEEAKDTIRRARPHTMTSPDALFSLIESTRYIVRHDVPGVFVECGVWRGGSMVAVALTLQRLGVTDRDLWLYDTFEGMTDPTPEDLLLRGDGTPADDLMAQTPIADGENIWSKASIQHVQAAMAATGYPAERLRFVTGSVEETIPGTVPETIAVLRLDTDWYESTRHELEHLMPLVSTGGVLIVDDYWYWQGCRQAVDEYLARTHLPMLLTPAHITAVGVVPPR